MNRSCLALLAGPLGLALLFPSAGRTDAATSLFAESVVIQGDEFVGTGIDSASSTTGDPVSVAAGVTYDLEGVGLGGELSFFGEGSALATYGVLKASAEGSLQNSFFDSEYNFDDGTGEVPTVYTTQSIARFEDTLQYGGTATGYNSKYIFRVSGNILGEGATAVVLVTHGMATPQAFIFDTPGAFDEIIVSNSFVGSADQRFVVELLATYDAFTEFIDDGASLVGAADFGSTVELLGIEARDDAGTLLPTSDFTSVSGTTYQILEAIPEPAGLLLATLAGLSVAGRGRVQRR